MLELGGARAPTGATDTSVGASATVTTSSGQTAKTTFGASVLLNPTALDLTHWQVAQSAVG